MNGQRIGLFVGDKRSFQRIELWSCPLRPVLTPDCLDPRLLVLTGMELWPFRGEVAVLLPLLTTDGLLRDEVGVVAV